METVFPHGCYLVGEVEPVRDFEKSTKERFVQSRDKNTNELVWQVAVMDGDPKVKAAQKTVAIKMVGNEEPQTPAFPPGMPFVPVAFDQIAVTPYVHQGTGRLAYAYRAKGLRPVRTTTGTGTATASGSAS
ncbi:plasmid replication, integration and excision activator [Nonomuraea sp. NPDC026600]|uniref:plasmid replication, integration and excision activator n=1 Tax=Nonomuraea sp. NPDC026600 TaxID=3155363 RepID=UPI00341156A4